MLNQHANSRPADVALSDAPGDAVVGRDRPTVAGGRYRLVIEPRRGWQALNLRELWRFRELLYFLVWRDVKVRYKQTVLGAAWAVLQPVMTMVVFSVFFGKLGGMAQHTQTAFPVFVYAALLPWTFFAAAVSQAGVSLVGSTHLVSKVYFPRLLVPLAAVGGNLVDCAISFVVMLGLMLAYGIFPTASMVLVPFFALGTALVAVGVGTLLAALVVAYRDFRYVINFLVQLWMFASPVAYPLEIVPARWQLLYALNPMAGLISGFRSALLGEPFRWDCIAVSLGVILAILAAGLFYFRRVERRFADVI
jgi:lipopolysaccharide transport system permease protein